jgi:DNA-binding response OmpR family regulator
MNVLIVEDDKSVGRFLEQAMAEAGYYVQRVLDGQQGYEIAVRQAFDLILLDVMVPSLNGFEVCRLLRAQRVTTPILIITAKDTLEDKVEGLDSGADDYLVKPFQIAELLARTRSLMRRSQSSPGVMRVTDLFLDPVKRQATRAGKNIFLSATEYTLLEYLMLNAGRVVTRPMILEHVWQYDFNGNDSVLDVYISYLRSKIDKGSEAPLIHTVRGIGYRIGDPDDA